MYVHFNIGDGGRKAKIVVFLFWHVALDERRIVQVFSRSARTTFYSASSQSCLVDDAFFVSKRNAGEIVYITERLFIPNRRRFITVVSEFEKYRDLVDPRNSLGRRFARPRSRCIVVVIRRKQRRNRVDHGINKRRFDFERFRAQIVFDQKRTRRALTLSDLRYDGSCLSLSLPLDDVTLSGDAYTRFTGRTPPPGRQWRAINMAGVKINGESIPSFVTYRGRVGDAFINTDVRITGDAAACLFIRLAVE